MQRLLRKMYHIIVFEVYVLLFCHGVRHFVH